MIARNTRYEASCLLCTVCFLMRAHELQQVKQDLYRLESLSPGTEEYHKLIEDMMARLHHHNDDEEIKDLPALEAVISKESSKEAALSFKKTKKLVPTRLVPVRSNIQRDLHTRPVTEVILPSRTSLQQRPSLGSSKPPSTR